MLPGYVLGLGSRGLVVGLLGTGRVGIGGIVSGIFLGTGGVELPGRGWLEEALFAFVGAEPSEGESADLFCPTGDACGGDGGTSGDQSASGVGVDGEGSVLTSVSVTVPAETVPAGAPEPEAVAAAGDSGKAAAASAPGAEAGAGRGARSGAVAASPGKGSPSAASCAFQGISASVKFRCAFTSRLPYGLQVPSSPVIGLSQTMRCCLSNISRFRSIHSKRKEHSCAVAASPAFCASASSRTARTR